MDSTEHELLLAGFKNLSFKQLSKYTSSGSPPPGTHAIPNGSPHLLERTRIYLSEREDGIDNSAASHSVEHPVLLSAGLQVLSVDQLQTHPRPISPPPGATLSAPIPHGVQVVEFEEIEKTRTTLSDQFSIVVSAAHRTNSVPDLPNELIINILACLSWRDVVRCRHVCRWVRDEVDQSVKFQYLIALGLASLEDRPESGPTATADRLRLLSAQQQAWRNLACCKAVTLAMQFDSEDLLYDFPGPMFAMGETGHSVLHCVSLPTAKEVEHGVEVDWSYIKLGFKLADFSMDIEQDLLVLIELPDDGQLIRFHFWTLSTHIPHPAASSSTLEHPSKTPHYGEIRIQIVGSHMGVIFPSSTFCDGGRLTIYSWTTGHTRAYVEAPLGSKLRSFAFISPYVVVVPWEATLDLYSFDPLSTVDPTPVSKPLVSFKLPDSRLANYYYFECFTRPYLQGDRSHLKSEIKISSFLPYTVEKEDGIIAFWLQPDMDALVFVIHRSTLLSYLNGLDDSQGIRIVDWHAWGPKNTRWFNGFRHVYWMQTVSGHRMVKLEPSKDDEGREFVIILDFNPVLISKSLTRSVASDLVTGSSPVGGEFFYPSIESELPYLETRSSASFLCSAAVLDDHRILLLQVCPLPPRKGSPPGPK